jgi:hypothetical protein
VPGFSPYECWICGGKFERNLAAVGRAGEHIRYLPFVKDDLVQLPAETWRAVRRRSWELLDIIELEGLVGAERWLRGRGLAYGVIRLPGVAPP